MWIHIRMWNWNDSISNYLGKVNKSVNAKSEGGCVKIDIDDFVYMTGPAVKICEGTLEV